MKVLLTGEGPISDNDGVMVAPDGKPETFSVTGVSGFPVAELMFGLLPVTVKEICVPGETEIEAAEDEPLIRHDGGDPPGFKLLSIKKSSGTRDFTLPFESKSETHIWTNHRPGVTPAALVFQVIRPVAELIVSPGGG